MATTPGMRMTGSGRPGEGAGGGVGAARVGGLRLSPLPPRNALGLLGREGAPGAQARPWRWGGAPWLVGGRMRAREPPLSPDEERARERGGCVGGREMRGEEERVRGAAAGGGWSLRTTAAAGAVDCLPWEVRVSQAAASLGERSCVVRRSRRCFAGRSTGYVPCHPRGRRCCPKRW